MFLHSLYQYDATIFLWINHWPHTVFTDKLAQILHYGTNGMVIYILLYAALLLMKKYRETWYILASMLITAAIVNYIIKPLIHRLRPFTVIATTVLLFPAPHTFSFPSAEAAAAWSVAVATNLIFKNKWWRLMYAWAILVSLDRIYMGHHYPSDVLAGAIVGSLISFLIFRITLKYRP